MTNNDAYDEIAELYLSIVSPQAAKAEDIDDPLMSEWIAQHASDGAKILDAGCGLGFQTVALHRGLPARATGKRFEAYGCDFSPAMLKKAVDIGLAHGLPSERFCLSSFAELGDKGGEWTDFDVIMVNGAVYTFPEHISIDGYDAYFQDCVRGLGATLKSGGHLIFNVRNWSGLLETREADHFYQETHGGMTYFARYAWTFGQNGHHVANLRMSNSSGFQQETVINFAERTPGRLIELAEACGFTLVYQGLRPAKSFYTIALKRLD